MVSDSKPIVSVIMAVYNTPLDYLTASIDSILEQTYIDFEFIIVDDGNTNSEILNCLAEYSKKDARINVISNSTNIGLTKSLNVALKKCQGKYIARMDSDDISLPVRFEKQVKYLEEHEEIALLGSNTIGFNGDIVIYDESEIKHSEDYLERIEIRFLIENVGFAHPTFMFRKSFLDENNIKYREELRYAQDYAIMTDVMIAGGKVYRIHQSLLKYREHEGQISQKSHDKQMECQAATSYRRLRVLFNSLSDKDCMVISGILGSGIEYSPSDYISAIKKMIKENSEKKLFNNRLFKAEFKYEWYRKCMRNMRILRRPWGITSLFSVGSIPAVVRKKLLLRE